MASLNKVILIGRLTSDPDKRYTSSGLAISSFSIAVDRPFKDQSGDKKTDFFRCKAWRQKADYIAEYGQKGRLVAVEGRIEINETTGQDGQKRFFTDIVCDNVEFLESSRDRAGEAAPGGGFGGGGRDNGSNGYDDAGGNDGGGSNGYFADDEPAPVRAPQRQAPAAPARQAPPRQAQAAPAARPQAPRAPQRQPEPAYPAADDFDDSDPFADE